MTTPTRFWLKAACYTLPAVLMAAAQLALQAVGLVLIPLLVPFVRPTPSKSPLGPVCLNPPRAFWLWGNDQEGWDPAWHQAKHPGWPRYWRMVQWAAIRNPVNNLRYVRWCNPQIQNPWRTIQTRTCGSWELRTAGLFGRLLRPGASADWLLGWKITTEQDMAAQAALWGAPLPWGFGIRYRRHKA